MPNKSKNSKNSFIKDHRTATIVVSCLIIVIVIPVLYIGYLGFVPGVSNVFGSNRPRDLGVRYDNEDLQAYNEKTSVAFMDSMYTKEDPANPAENQVLANPKYAKDLVLSDEELTASINSLGWDWLPFEEVQARFTDNTLELSGMLNLEKVDDFNTHVSGQENVGLNNAINWVKRFEDSVPFYAKVNASIENNTLTYTIVKAEIGRAAVPFSLFNSKITQETSTAYIQTKNFNIDYASLSEGNLTFSGVYPTIIYLDL